MLIIAACGAAALLLFHTPAKYGSDRFRQIFIVSRDVINLNSPVIVIIPVTKATNVKRSYPNNVLSERGNCGLTVDSVALGGQVRAITKSRLPRHRDGTVARCLP